MLRPTISDVRGPGPKAQGWRKFVDRGRRAALQGLGHLRRLILVFVPGAAIVSFILASVIVAQPPRRSITIKTEPGAQVWIDGILYGTAADSGMLAVNSVLPGRKTIRVRADGFKETNKTLLASQSGAIAIPLAKTSDGAELAFQKAERLTTVNRQKASAAYEQAIKLRPGYLDAYIGLVRVQVDGREFEKAARTIAAARRLKPGWAELSAVEGRMLKSVGEEEKAVAAFKRAIREGRGFQPEAYAGLGLLYKEKAENAGAAGESDQEKALYLEAAKNLAQAIVQLSGAPDAVTIYQILGLIYEDQKQPAKAIAVYEEFIRLFPDDPESETFQSFIVQLKKQQQNR